jgi:hypothetical protein
MLSNNRRMTTYRRKFLTISFLAFVSAFGGCVSYEVRADIKRDAYFREQAQDRANGLPNFTGPYCFPDPHPRILRSIVLLTFSVFALLFFCRNSLMALPAAILSFSAYPFWYRDTKSNLGMAELYEAKGIDNYLLNAGTLDVVSGILTTFLTASLIWFAVVSFKRFIAIRKMP